MVVVVVKSTCPKRRPWITHSGAGVPGVLRERVYSETFLTAFCIVMHRLARSLVTTAAGYSKTTSAATRLAANWQRRAAARSTILPWSTSRRSIHVRVPLPYKVEDGMGDFLSPAALKVIAEDYQQGLLDRLNEQIKGNASVSVSYIYTNPRTYWRVQVPTLKIRASLRLSSPLPHTRAKRSHSTMRVSLSTTVSSCTIS